MALAICFDQLIKDGVVVDRAELARLGRVTRARLTQIMNLLNLAPDLQEQILQFSHGERQIPRLCERTLRTIVAAPDWRRQRSLWQVLPSLADARVHSA